MLIKGWKPVTKKILGIIVPAVLAGIALALALFRLSLAGGDSVTSMALVPAAAGLLIAHIMWERPRRGETLLGNKKAAARTIQVSALLFSVFIYIVLSYFSLP